MPRARYRARRPARTATTGNGDGWGAWIRSWSKVTWLFALALLLGVVFAFIAVVVDPTIAGRWAEGLAGRLAPFFGSGG